MPPSNPTSTDLLCALARGEGSAAEKLTPVLYDELRAIAGRILRRERPGHTLQATALVSEAYLRLIDQDSAGLHDRAQFLALAATMMRRILVDHSRAAARLKRGGHQHSLTLHEASALTEGPEFEVLDVDDALMELQGLDSRQARLVELRFFAGASIPEAALALGVSERTVNDDWRMARAWLRRRLEAH